MAEGSVLCIKGSFKGDVSFGAFYLYLDIASEKFSSCRFAIKSGTSLKNIDIHTDFSDFSKNIENIFQSISETDPIFDYIAALETLFIKSFPDDKLKKIIKLLNSSGDDYLRNILIRDILSQEIKKYYTELTGKVNIQIEFLSQKEEENSNAEKDTPDKQTDIMLKIKALMDPINGKIVENLTTKDELIVKLTNPEDLKDYYNKLNFFEDSKDISKAKVIAKITEIKESESEDLPDLKIMLRLAPKLYSLIIIQPKLKIMAINDEDEVDENNEIKSNESQFSSNITLIISALVTVIILLIILFMIFT